MGEFPREFMVMGRGARNCASCYQRCGFARGANITYIEHFLQHVPSIAAVLSKGVDEMFPRDAVGRAKFVRDWLVKNAPADLMFKNQEGIVRVFGIV